MSSSSNDETPGEELTQAEATETVGATLTPEELDVLQEDDELILGDGVEPFDLSRPRVLRPNQQEGLETLFATSSKLVTPIMKHELRTEVLVEFLGGEPVYFEHCLTQLPDPLNVFPVTYRGMDFQGALCLDEGMSFWFVDTLLGGGDSAGDDRVRSLTETESAVATKVVELILDEIHTSLAPEIQLESTVEGFVSQRTQLHTVKLPSLAYAVRFSVQWKSEQGFMQYLLPFKLLRPLVQSMEPKTDEQREKRLSALMGALGQAFLSVDLDVTAVLGRPTVTLGQLGNLEVGDVLPIGAGLDDPIEVAVQGVPKVTGAFGIRGGKYAVVVQSWIRDI